MVIPRSVALQGNNPDVGLLISMPFGPSQMVYDVTVLDGYLEPSRFCFLLEDYIVQDGSSPYVVIQEVFNQLSVPLISAICRLHDLYNIYPVYGLAFGSFLCMVVRSSSL